LVKCAVLWCGFVFTLQLCLQDINQQIHWQVCALYMYIDVGLVKCAALCAGYVFTICVHLAAGLTCRTLTSRYTGRCANRYCTESGSDMAQSTC
jgi:hypothetical protein